MALWQLGSAIDGQILRILVVFSVLVFFIGLIFFTASRERKRSRFRGSPNALQAYLRFMYSCFLKPHSGNGNHQDALESFYKTQASAYDATRRRLLKGREDLLGLVAAQLKHRKQTGVITRKPVWVDIGGGTGYNIEAMDTFVPVTEFFQSVYLVDLSPSLCAIARQRFERLGWDNVKIVCQDARSFKIEEHEPFEDVSAGLGSYDGPDVVKSDGVELITMSYALSMIPDFYSVVDSLSTLLLPNGIIGATDFYVQSVVDYQNRNYTGGVIDRHCIWLSRVFWRSWFEVDRVNLDSSRRDYLEYRFGTVLSFNARNKAFGVHIPYYVWVGCAKILPSSHAKLAEWDAAATESPFLKALDLQNQNTTSQAGTLDIRSKAYECAIVNLAASLPLPACWYQNHHWRIYFDATLAKYKQFHNNYIYAFTWEDSRVDSRLLKIQSDDVILAITSAGDNILSYALEGPKRIHAVDLNPAQNHLLELKVAAFTALGYSDVWKLFGEGKHKQFRELLITKLSPHMSSLAFQFWLAKGREAFHSQGLYFTGGSRLALKLVYWLFRIFRLTGDVKLLCAAQTLNEQREIWQRRIRKLILNRTLSWSVIGNEKWLWRALGVPPEQRSLIEEDYLKQQGLRDINGVRSGHAIWEYGVNTLDPVISNTLLSEDNYYYLLCIQGRYNQRCHPPYLTPKAHVKLSRPDAFDSLRIHTDEINEVIARMAPDTLTIAVVMDSMDWFPPLGREAASQITELNRVMKLGGRVLLRSAGLSPWYIKTFEELGFTAKRVGVRLPGTCIDRVNMYASTWICTKSVSLNGPTSRSSQTITPLEQINI